MCGWQTPTYGVGDQIGPRETAARRRRSPSATPRRSSDRPPTGHGPAHDGSRPSGARDAGLPMWVGGSPHRHRARQRPHPHMAVAAGLCRRRMKMPPRPPVGRPRIAYGSHPCRRGLHGAREPAPRTRPQRALSTDSPMQPSAWHRRCGAPGGRGTVRKLHRPAPERPSRSSGRHQGDRTRPGVTARS